jgi:sugar/nucleoside kinase (ribokinase family)
MKTTTAAGDAIGFGAAALDFYLPTDVVGPDYEPGAKVDLGPKDEEYLTRVMADITIERHVGGNAMNVLAYLSRQGSYRNIGFMSVLGANCEISTQILNHRDTRHRPEAPSAAGWLRPQREHN